MSEVFWMVLVFGNLAAFLWVARFWRTAPTPAQVRTARVAAPVLLLIGLGMASFGFLVQRHPVPPARVAQPQTAAVAR